MRDNCRDNLTLLRAKILSLNMASKLHFGKEGRTFIILQYSHLSLYTLSRYKKIVASPALELEVSRELIYQQDCNQFINIILLCSITKGVKRRVSTMYFYINRIWTMYIHYTRVAFHRFTIGSLVVGLSSSSPPQSWISTLAREY